MRNLKLPTDKQYIYYLIISQLYNDGYMEAAMRLEMATLDSTGQVLPSNRLSSILSNCLLSFSDVTNYLDKVQGGSSHSRQSVVSPELPPSSTLNHISSMTRKRLHSGPPGFNSHIHRSNKANSHLHPGILSHGLNTHLNTLIKQNCDLNTSSSFLDSSSVSSLLASSAGNLASSGNYASAASSASLAGNSISNKKLVSSPSSFKASATNNLISDSVSNNVPHILLPEHLSNGGGANDHVNVSEANSVFESGNEPTEQPSQLSKELEEICKAVQGSDVSLTSTLNTTNSTMVTPLTTSLTTTNPTITATDEKKEINIKTEMVEVTAQSESTSQVEEGITDSDIATQNLIKNLSNISDADIHEISELTASLVESLVHGSHDGALPQGSGNHGNAATGSTQSTPSTAMFNTSAGEDQSSSASTSPTSSADLVFSSAALGTSSADGAKPEFPALQAYKQNNSLLNIMGYNNNSLRIKPFRRHRTRFNDEQINAMEAYYNNVSRYARPDNGLTELIQLTGLTHDTIMLWFQNKRARDKRKGWDDSGGPGIEFRGKKPKVEFNT